MEPGGLAGMMLKFLMSRKGERSVRPPGVAEGQAALEQPTILAHLGKASGEQSRVQGFRTGNPIRSIWGWHSYRPAIEGKVKEFRGKSLSWVNI